MSPAPSFELLRLVALPAGAEVAVLELEGRLRPAAQRPGTTPRAIKARLLLEDDDGRLDIPAATCDLEGRVLRATFAVPTSRLEGAALAVGVRDLLFDLPAPDTIPGAEREIALAREANTLRRDLAAARAELAQAEEEREAALADVRREEEERLAAAELLIAREREEAAAREAALAEEVEAVRRGAAEREGAARAAAAAREDEVRRDAEARLGQAAREAEGREEAARREGAAAVAEARREADERTAALEAELDAVRREADAREEQVRREAAARVQAAREEAERAAASPSPSAPPAPSGAAPAQPGPAPARPAPPAAAARAEQPTMELGAVSPPPAAARERADPEPPTIRPSTAAGRSEPASRRARGAPVDPSWQEPGGAAAGGLFDEPYDPGPGAPRGAGPGGSLLADPADLDDEDATAPQPLRRVRRTGEPVPPRGQPATQVRARPAGGSRPEEPAVGEASILRYIVLGFVLLTILLVVLAILAL